MSGPGPIAVDSQLVRVGGRQVRMRVVGDGEPLLLLNGLTRPLESWEPFTQALSGRTLISFDAPGVGGSPTPILPMSISMLAALAASLLDQVGLDRADVLGFSHGGAVAQQLAAQTPEKVHRLVLVSTSCGMGATPGGAQGALRGRPQQSEGRSWPQPNPLGMLWHSLAISSWSSIPFLGAIAVPTLVVSGAHDRVVPPENSALLARRIPGAELVLLPAGHDLQRRGPASALAGVVEPFLVAGSDLAPLTFGG
jgi:pimeloyl-ACP methyl ester carboxylesterase